MRVCRRCMSGGGRVSAAFDAFLASVDPVAVERERFGMPGRGERPGSADDRLMRIAHEAIATEFRHRRDFPSATPGEIRRMLAAEVAHHERTIYKQSPEGRAAQRIKRAAELENRSEA